MDYIRSVSFHHEAPWIASASDDQTVRIWNWQSRQCVAVLSGHNHYVMCAAFHPTEDLLVSASLDQTVRVWDLSNIRAKNAPSVTSTTTRKGSFSQSSSNSPQIDLFVGSGLETSVKFILEGHDRGVNWVQFHPTRPLIVSGSDDRTVKIWRYNDVRAWEIETLRGHSNNVSSVLWHPRADYIISDAEDRTLRIWDCSGSAGSGSSGSGSLSSRGKCVISIKKDNDRFWCLSAHPEMNIFAAGHDNGLIVFKMNRERPAYTLTPDAASSGDCLYYVRDKLVRSFALDSGTDSDEFVAPLDHVLKLPSTLAFSPTERVILISSADSTGTAIQLRDKNSFAFTGLFATFVGRNRFVTLTDSQILLQSTTGNSNEIKPLPSPAENIQRLLPGPLGTFLAVSPQTVFLMDGTSGRVISSIDAVGVKYVSWSPNFEHVALMAKRIIYLSDKSLKSIHATHTDSTGVKSGTWDVSNPIGAIFYYTNSFHLKYLLPQGDSGIICTTSTPLYLVRVQGDLVHVLDRGVSVLVLGIDPTECHFKLALQKGNSAQIENLITNSNLVGQAIIAYLREKGHAAIALQFVKDPNSRFDLALECSNLQVAWEAAEIIDSPSIWNKLADEALQMGKTETALKAFALSKNSSKLNFLSTVLATPIPTESQDIFQAVISGNVNEMAKMFTEGGFDVLAHLASSGKSAVTVENPQLGNFLMRRSQVAGPVNAEISDWPLLFDPSTKITALSEKSSSKAQLKAAICDDGWGIEDDLAIVEEEKVDDMFGDDFDIPLDEDDFALLGDAGALASEFFDLELPETLPEDISIPTIFSVNQFRQELQLQNGLVKMSSEMMEAVEKIVSAQSFHLPGPFGVRSIPVPDSYNSLNFGESEHLPLALQATTQGRFPEALEHFRKFLQLSAVSPIQGDPKDLILARDYIIGLLVELRRKDMGETGDQALALDLAVLFTRCPLKPEHHLLSLRAALAASYKCAAYKTAAHLARRILSLPSGSAPDAVILQARKVLAVAEKANYSESIDGIKYGAFADDQPWIVDPVDFMRLNDENGNGFECQYCHAKYGNLHDCCSVCEVGLIQ